MKNKKMYYIEEYKNGIFNNKTLNAYSFKEAEDRVKHVKNMTDLERKNNPDSYPEVFDYKIVEKK